MPNQFDHSVLSDAAAVAAAVNAAHGHELLRVPEPEAASDESVARPAEALLDPQERRAQGPLTDDAPDAA
jgi:hypothetical protein